MITEIRKAAAGGEEDTALARPADLRGALLGISAARLWNPRGALSEIRAARFLESARRAAGMYIGISATGKVPAFPPLGNTRSGGLKKPVFSSTWKTPTGAPDPQMSCCRAAKTFLLTFLAHNIKLILARGTVHIMAQ